MVCDSYYKIDGSSVIEEELEGCVFLVPLADLLLVNKDRTVAVSIGGAASEKYFLMSKSQGEAAQKSVLLAKEYDIPIIEDTPLTRVIYAAGELQRQIEPEFVSGLAKTIKDNLNMIESCEDRTYTFYEDKRFLQAMTSPGAAGARAFCDLYEVSCEKFGEDADETLALVCYCVITSLNLLYGLKTNGEYESALNTCQYIRKMLTRYGYRGYPMIRLDAMEAEILLSMGQLGKAADIAGKAYRKLYLMKDTMDSDVMGSLLCDGEWSYVTKIYCEILFEQKEYESMKEVCMEVLDLWETVLI